MREIILSSAGIHLIQCDSSYIYILSNFLMCIITPGLKHIYLKPTSHSLPHHQISQEALTMQRGNPYQHNSANIQPRANCSCVSLWQIYPGSAQTWAHACNNPLVVHTLRQSIPALEDTIPSRPQQRALQPTYKSITSQRALHWEGKGPWLCITLKLSPVSDPNHVFSWCI